MNSLSSQDLISLSLIYFTSGLIILASSIISLKSCIKSLV